MRAHGWVLVVALTAAACSAPSEPPPSSAEARDSSVAPPEDAAGAPKLGPGERFNACERIWCLSHEGNFAIEHFLEAHVGWILHDDVHGDVFAPRGRTAGPAMPGANTAMLRLCGRHLHPWIYRRGKGAVRRGGYSAALGYDRKHYATFGTRLEPCCRNGLGWGFLHAASPEQFRIHDVALYREAPGIGWQKPYRPVASSR